MNFWEALASLPAHQLFVLLFALVMAFGFEVINGFHDTANAVTTVIYSHSLKATPAVVYSGFMNFFGVLAGGTTVAFSIVHLLPVDMLIDASSNAALVMVLSLLLSGVIWNLGTWYYGLPVSSSHTLIGSILGVGIANGRMIGEGIYGVNWGKAADVGLALLISPMIGFGLAFVCLKIMKATVKNPALYTSPNPGQKPPGWIRGILLATCGGVSFAHGSNDGQKGMGLILLVLIGMLPAHYSLNNHHDGRAEAVHTLALAIEERNADRPELTEDVRVHLATLTTKLRDKQNFTDLAEDTDERWQVRRAIFGILRHKELLGKSEHEVLSHSIEFVPLWVVIGTAIALGGGTMIGYKRIVVTVAEKIGKSHLTYGQGAAAEMVAATTIALADIYHMPVSTTHVLSSGVAGTMAANHSGVQRTTILKIALAWVLTMPCAMILAAGLYTLGRAFFH